MAVVAGVVAGVGQVASAQCGAAWDVSFCPGGVTSLGGAIAQIRCMEVFDDGRGPALFIGGTFEVVAGQVAWYIARWDGSTWESIPGITSTGGTNGYGVQSLEVHDDGTGPALFIGGHFGVAGVSSAYTGVVKWDGTSITACPGGWDQSFAGQIPALLSWNGQLLASALGSTYLPCSGVLGYGTIHVWDGVSWDCFFDCPHAISGASMVVHGGELFVRGLNICGCGAAFSCSASGCGKGGVLRVTPSGPVGTGLGQVHWCAPWDWSARALISWNGVLYSPGALGGATGGPPIAWDGASTWSGVGAGLDGSLSEVLAMEAFDDGCGEALYVAGLFPSIDGDVAGKGIGKLADGEWVPVGGGIVPVGGGSFAMRTFEDSAGRALYVGSVSQAGGMPATGIARLHLPAPIIDLDGDGKVGGADLGLLLAAWGSSDPAADLDHDGVVAGGDLGLLLAAWDV